MNLKEIEEQLKEIRIRRYRNNLNIFPLTSQKSIILGIENGKGYAIQSLFNYIRDLDLILLVNDEMIFDAKSLGKFLKEIRKRNNIRQIDGPSLMGLNRTRIYKIENGYGNRFSLEKYLKYFKIEFQLSEISPYNRKRFNLWLKNHHPAMKTTSPKN